MRLHPRLFNRFLLVTAAISAIAIVFFGIRYAGNQEAGFNRRLGDGTIVLDSLGIDPSGRPVTVLFWATWSKPSTTLLHELAADTSRRLVAAYVRDDTASVGFHIRQGPYDGLDILNGTSVFQSLKAPGVPTAIRYTAGGRLESVTVGTP